MPKVPCVHAEATLVHAEAARKLPCVHAEANLAVQREETPSSETR
jgi:hypothetical protein